MILKKCFVLLAMLHFFGDILSQKVNVTGSCRLRIETNMSRDQAKKEVMKCAITNAIENEFGTKIIQTEIISSSTQSSSQSETTKSSSVYNSVGNLEVSGEWVETRGEPAYTYQKADNGDEFIECIINGTARPLKKIAINFDAFAITNDGIKDSKTFYFNNNQNLFFYFKSAKDGYLNIYLDDTKNAFQLLPYKSNNIVNYPVVLDKDYYFFSKKNGAGNDKTNLTDKVDELIMATDEQAEQNTMYVIFSTKPFDKPILQNDNLQLGQSDKKSGFELPKYLSSVLFHEYIQKLRKARDDIEINEMTITIYNRKTN